MNTKIPPYCTNICRSANPKCSLTGQDCASERKKHYLVSEEGNGGKLASSVRTDNLANLHSEEALC
jgi:hypothetical protein